jgi:hypothetical protein
VNITIYDYTDDVCEAEGFSADEIKLVVPAKNEVCSTCQGKGTHVNPSIDGSGLSREDFEREGPEFQEDYFRGVYDVTCYECKGHRVVLCPDCKNVMAMLGNHSDEHCWYVILVDTVTGERTKVTFKSIVKGEEK